MSSTKNWRMLLCKHWDWEGRQSNKNLQQDKWKRMLQRLAINDNNSICFVLHKNSNFNCNLVSKIGKFMQSMSCSKKRKILDKGRIFKDKWFVKYFAVQQNERVLYSIAFFTWLAEITLLVWKNKYQEALQFQVFRTIRGNFKSVACWKSPSVTDVIAGAGTDLGRGDWAVRPSLKPTKVTSFAVILYNSENSIRDIGTFCCPLFRYRSVVKYTLSPIQ